MEIKNVLRILQEKLNKVFNNSEDPKLFSEFDATVIHEITENLYKNIEIRPKVCEILYEQYCILINETEKAERKESELVNKFSSEKELETVKSQLDILIHNRLFIIQLIPTLITIYMELSANSNRNPDDFISVAVLLQGIYNLEANDSSNCPRVFGFRIPDMRSPSIYHEAFAMPTQGLTKDALATSTMKMNVVSGIYPDIDIVNDRTKFIIVQFLLQIYVMNISRMHKVSLSFFCEMCQRLTTKGFTKKPSGERVILTSNLFLGFLRGLYYIYNYGMKDSSEEIAHENQLKSGAILTIYYINQRANYEMWTNVMAMTNAMITSIRNELALKEHKIMDTFSMFEYEFQSKLISTDSAIENGVRHLNLNNSNMNFNGINSANINFSPPTINFNANNTNLNNNNNNNNNIGNTNNLNLFLPKSDEKQRNRLGDGNEHRSRLGSSKLRHEDGLFSDEEQTHGNKPRTTLFQNLITRKKQQTGSIDHDSDNEETLEKQLQRIRNQNSIQPIDGDQKFSLKHLYSNEEISNDTNNSTKKSNTNKLLNIRKSMHSDLVFSGGLNFNTGHLTKKTVKNPITKWKDVVNTLDRLNNPNQFAPPIKINQPIHESHESQQHPPISQGKDRTNFVMKDQLKPSKDENFDGQKSTDTLSNDEELSLNKPLKTIKQMFKSSKTKTKFANERDFEMNFISRRSEKEISANPDSGGQEGFASESMLMVSNQKESSSNPSKQSVILHVKKPRTGTDRQQYRPSENVTPEESSLNVDNPSTPPVQGTDLKAPVAHQETMPFDD
ncbi:hypothetical protein SNEBB_003572 [Seison nebaliae]|nr:hypothetical protein SNEBB_003572 [Seison nebaliae]